MEVFAAVSLPGLVVLIMVVAVLEAFWVWFTGLGLVPWLRKRTGRSITTAVLTDFTRPFEPGKDAEIEHHAAQQLLTDDSGNGAPPEQSEGNEKRHVGRPHRTLPGLDLRNGIVYIGAARNDAAEGHVE